MALIQGRQLAICRSAQEQLSRTFSQRAYVKADAFKIISIIGDNATRPRFTDYSGSVQAVMAIDTLLNGLVTNGHVTAGSCGWHPR